ncbi:MAG: hypothetical protein JNK87_36525 [Bryobacterales bacterium]|nr:hypothetical protein [Bryobacterales bacterium]
MTLLMVLAAAAVVLAQDEVPSMKIKDASGRREQLRTARRASAVKGKAKERDAATAPDLREAILTNPIPFFGLTPCRVLDTRFAPSLFGGPVMAAGSTRTVAIPQSRCGVPSTAQAYSLNITVVPRGPLSYLSVFPTGAGQPLVSTLNAFDGGVVSNAAIVPAGSNGTVDVFVTNLTDVIVDINGYFAPGAGAEFFPVTPCRVADTRVGSGKVGSYGPPAIAGGSTRTMSVNGSGCQGPADAKAYSLNITVVPNGPLGYLSVYPAGQAQPVVSTLNSFTGRVTANAAIVPAGNLGSFTIYVTNTTNVIVDVNGYFR